MPDITLAHCGMRRATRWGMDIEQIQRGAVVRFKRSGKLYVIDKVAQNDLNAAGYVHYYGATDNRAHGCCRSFADFIRKFDLVEAAK